MATSIRVFHSLARNVSRPCVNACVAASRRAAGPRAATRFLSNSAVRWNEKNDEAPSKLQQTTQANVVADGTTEATEGATPSQDVLTATLEHALSGDGAPETPASTPQDSEYEDALKFWDQMKTTLDGMDMKSASLREEENDYGYVVPRTGEEAMDDPMFPEWEADDMSSIAHSEMDRHREARHYARIMVYEMPKLSQLSVPFKPPGRKRILRFRYTTYMGVQHPAEQKVVVEVSPKDIDFDEDWQRNKFIKLCGPRYNPAKDLVKISCEIFKEQAQNKRYLVGLVNSLVKEAKVSKDKFEDVPFDFRRHKSKPKRPWFYFPKGWRMPEDKLEEKRWRDWEKATDAQREQSLKLYAANEAEAKRITKTKKDYVEFLNRQSTQIDDREMLEMTSGSGYADKMVIPVRTPSAPTIQMAPVIQAPSTMQSIFERE